MMKYFLSFFTLLATAVSINAQPVLQANNLPPIGYQLDIYSFNGAVLNAGDTGANQLWDFTALADSLTPVLTSAMSPRYIKFIDFPTSPFSAEFPASNYCLESNDSPTRYYYFTGDSNLFSEDAHNITGDTAQDKNGIFSIPHILLEFPANYRQAIKTTWQLADGPIMHDTITYDAYGTLKTSLGTITNVARVTIKSTGTPKNYEFWTTNPAFPLLGVSSEDVSLLYVPKLLNGIDETRRLPSLTISPNPSSGPAELQFSLDRSTLVDARLYDLAGKEIKQLYNGNLLPGKNSFKIDDGNLAPGMYIISVKAGGASGNVKYIKV